MVRSNFDNELKELYINMLKMASIIEKSMDDLIKVLHNKDKVLAQEIIDRDDEVDRFDEWLTERSIHIILTQQPVASDLRKVVAAMKMVTDLERIADHCVDISEYLIDVDNNINKNVKENIQKMAEFVKNMVHDIINCFVDSNVTRAQQIAKDDDKVDDLFYEIINELEELLKTNPENSHALISHIFIVKYLERMADHVTNVSEWIIYQNTGEIEIHHYNEDKN